ncbi:MAG: prepilin-type N-terminal cleavage/methylation domain-containing protein [Lachnospiraceae bacterium]|nr:prepilin-type N-terminal cleavage/methylation domain-containing protein [Lachnospiraceae bacterium]
MQVSHSTGFTLPELATVLSVLIGVT